MDRFARFFCDPLKVIKFIAVLVFSIGIIIYAYFQAMGGFDNDIVTETSYLVSMNDSIEADAYIFRDESIVSKDGNGTIVTLVSEGDRVSKGQLIANVFPDATDASVQDDINRVQRRLDILEDSSVDAEFVISDLAKLDNDIHGIMADIFSFSSDGNLSGIIDNSSELLIKLNKRDLIVDSNFDFSSEMENLLAEETRLQNKISAISSPLFASSSGYFYGEIDGYEKTFDIDLVENMTLDLLEELSVSQPDESVLSKGGVKIVNDFIWYTVCLIDSQQVSKLEVGQSYNVSFPENAGVEIKMTLNNIVKETNSATALAIFRVNVLSGSFDYKRFQGAEIVLGGIEGLSVPKKALRIVDGVEGVYILVGDVIRFRRVERIAEKDDYYIVRHIKNNELFNEEETEEVIKIQPLSLYDNIVISGKKLFDGKIVG